MAQGYVSAAVNATNACWRRHTQSPGRQHCTDRLLHEFQLNASCMFFRLAVFMTATVGRARLQTEQLALWVQGFGVLLLGWPRQGLGGLQWARRHLLAALPVGVCRCPCCKALGSQPTVLGAITTAWGPGVNSGSVVHVCVYVSLFVPCILYYLCVCEYISRHAVLCTLTAPRVWPCRHYACMFVPTLRASSQQSLCAASCTPRSHCRTGQSRSAPATTYHCMGAGQRRYYLLLGFSMMHAAFKGAWVYRPCLTCSGGRRMASLVTLALYCGTKMFWGDVHLKLGAASCKTPLVPGSGLRALCVCCLCACCHDRIASLPSVAPVLLEYTILTPGGQHTGHLAGLL